MHDGEVMIRVHVAAINPVDYKLAMAPVVPSIKNVIGIDVSGCTVITLARDTTHFNFFIRGCSSDED